MEEHKENKKDNYEIKAVGKDMAELIKIVEDKFIEQYGFSPSIIDVTNLIAKRVVEANLF